jgi:peptidoglycan/LPS O-acetylase OafA/YrhL
MLILVAFASVWLLGPLRPQTATARTGISASLFAANFQLVYMPHGYFNVDTTSNALMHTWSLSLEEQFYLVFPGGLLLWWRLNRRGLWSRRVALGLGGVALLASLAFSCLASHGFGASLARRLGTDVQPLAFYLPFSRIWEFGGGVIIAALAPRLSNIKRTTAEVVGLIGFLMLCVGVTTISGSDPFPGVLAAWPVLGTMLLIVAGFHERAFVRRCLSFPALVWIGDISYGWYLWHWPLIVFARSVWPTAEIAPVIAAFLSLGPTLVSYRWLEEPVRRSSRLVGWRAVGLVGICIVSAVLACVGLRAARSVWIHRGDGPGILASQALHKDSVKGCGPDAVALSEGACQWSTSGPKKGTIYLAGDSNAGQFTEGVVASANALGYDVVTMTHPGCAFVDLEARIQRTVDDVGDSPAVCRAFVLDTVSAIVKAKPALVIVASDSSARIESPSTELWDPYSRAVARGPEAKAEMWESGLHKALAPLSAANISTVDIAPIPHPDNVAVATCPAFRIALDPAQCAPDTSRDAIEQKQRRAREAERRAVSSLPGFSFLDLTPELCSDMQCPSRRDGAWLYRDSGHISVAASVALAPTFARLISARATP